MDLTAIMAVPLGLVETFASMPNGPLIAGLLLALMAAATTALSIPGTIVPMSFTSGALLGLAGVFAIASGALVGSIGLFLLARHSLAERIRLRLGERLDSIGEHLQKSGPIYVVGARITGIPNLLVTAGSAVTPITTRTFAAASLLGMLPAIVIAAVAGSAI